MKIQQLRIRYMMENKVQINIPDKYNYYVDDIQAIESAKTEFYHQLRNNSDWKNILEIMSKFQKILFPDDQKLINLEKCFETKYISIDVDSRINFFLDIPWELIRRDISSDDANNLWGYNYVFQRRSSDMDAGQSNVEVTGKPVVGVFNYNNMPLTEQIKDFLRDLDQNNLIYRSCPINGCSKSEWLESIRNDIKELHIIHLSCLLLKLRYSEKAYLIFADELLLSIDDIKNLRLNLKKPIVIFDVTDNSENKVQIEQRNKFLSNIIKWGSAAVITNVCSVPKEFSTEFYCDLHKNLTLNKSLSVYEVLYNVRRSKFDRNPFALFFWLYGNSKLPQRDTQTTIGELSRIINNHSDKFQIDLWIDKLKKFIGSELNVDNYNDIEGTSKVEKLFYLSRQIEPYGNSKLEKAIDLFITLRPNDMKLKEEIDQWKESHL